MKLLHRLFSGAKDLGAGVARQSPNTYFVVDNITVMRAEQDFSNNATPSGRVSSFSFAYDKRG